MGLPQPPQIPAHVPIPPKLLLHFLTPLNSHPVLTAIIAQRGAEGKVIVRDNGQSLRFPKFSGEDVGGVPPRNKNPVSANPV